MWPNAPSAIASMRLRMPMREDSSLSVSQQTRAWQWPVLKDCGWQSWKASRRFARIHSHNRVFFDPGNPSTFLKETDIVVGKKSIQNVSHRVNWNTINSHLIMEMGTRCLSTHPNLSNLFSSFYSLSNFDKSFV
jgi:hypothetical protein